MQKYTIEQAANILYINPRTLRRYDKSGDFKALRHPSGRMYYTHEMLQDYQNGTYNPEDTKKYTILQKSPINIDVNTTQLPVIESESDDKKTYFKLINSEEYWSEYDVLEMREPEISMERMVQYSLGKFTETKEGKIYTPIFSWKSLRE